MATTNNPPSLASDLVRIHKVITRGLSVGTTKGAEFMQAGFPDTRTRQGFADYALGLEVVLDAHHLAEDEVLFPSLREKLPQAPYDYLSKNHKEIEALLIPVKQAVVDVAGRDVEAGLARLVEGLTEITAVWAPHIRMEESIFSHEALTKVMTLEELASLSRAVGKHSQEHSTPDYLALPFVLFNLNVEDRATMAAALPKEVLEVLLPKEWKDRWAPMKPFLLD